MERVKEPRFPRADGSHARERVRASNVAVNVRVLDNPGPSALSRRNARN